MKKLVVLAVAALFAITGCKNGYTPEEIAADRDAMDVALQAIRKDYNLNPDQKKAKTLECYEAVYEKHKKDSLKTPEEVFHHTIEKGMAALKAIRKKS